MVYLYLGENKLSTLDVTYNDKLVTLDLQQNQLVSTIDLTKNDALTFLNLSFNQLTPSIDLRKNILLESLYLHSNQLTSIDITKNTQLKNIALEVNQISSIDLTKNILLTNLNIGNNNIISPLDITYNPKLEYLNLANNQLTSIDLTKNTLLYKFESDHNFFSSIDLTKNVKLAILTIGHNKLTSIDLSKNVDLYFLSLTDNLFNIVDLSNNSKLRYFWIDFVLFRKTSKTISEKIIYPFPVTLGDLDMTLFKYDHLSGMVNSKNVDDNGWWFPTLRYTEGNIDNFSSTIFLKSAYITSSDPSSYKIDANHTKIEIPPSTTVTNLLSKLTAVNSVAKVYNNAVPSVEVTGNTPVLDDYMVNLYNGSELLGGYKVVASIPALEYDIVPSIELNAVGPVNVGQPYTVTAKIKNDGENATGINWEVHKLIFAPSSTFPTGEIVDTPQNPCASHSGYTACTIPTAPPASSGIGSYEASIFEQVYINNSYNVDNLPLGTSVCYVLSVKPHKYDTGDNWRHSEMECMKITKSPKFQVWGGDVRVGGKIQTSTTAMSSTSVYGSWAEYGLLSGGLITNTGSAAAFAPSGGGGSLASDYSYLSFNNINSIASCTSSTNIGCYYSTAPTAPNIANSFPIITSGPLQTPNIGTTDLNNPSKTGTFTGTGDISLNGGTIGLGRWVVINAPTATITINSDIKYSTGNINKIGDIPQVVIIAKNINIKGTVDNIDAWLVATDGAINTCSDVLVADNLTGNICKGSLAGKTLKINGPVIAKKLYLRRTHNVDPPSPNPAPAEIINLRADAYLWSASQATKTPRVQTIYTTEAPPRY